MHVVRWVAVPLVCVAAWIAAFFLGLFAHSVAESFCPADEMVSGMCFAPWFPAVEMWLIRIFSAVAAALVVTSAYFVAPAGRCLVAWAVFAVGATCALWIAAATSAWPEFIAAAIGGLVAVISLTRGRPVLASVSPVAPQNA